MSVRILIGDVRDRLKELPSDSVDCVVTSPPYWGLRDYGVEGQLGMERTLGEHVETMAAVFDEVRRILKPTGTLWLNYGDSYATKPNGRSAEAIKALGTDDRTFRDKPMDTTGPIYGHLDVEYEKTPRAGATQNMGNLASQSGPRVVGVGILKPKDLCGIPWRVAFALQERGWWLRQDIIWSKPNPMPESITDRCTKAHEYIFLLTKSARYHFDAEAIAEPLMESSIERLSQSNIENQRGSDRVPGKTNGPMKAVARRAKDAEASARNPDSRPHNLSEFEAKNGRSYERRNKRSVWTIATQPFSEAHFATFPPELVETCLKAGCPAKCCSKCGAPVVRVVERTPAEVKSPGSDYGIGAGRNDGGRSQLVGAKSETLGFAPSCKCNAEQIAGTVLDPFGGAGTVGLVADRMGLDATLIELNPAYVTIARNRIADDAGMFAKVAAE